MTERDERQSELPFTAYVAYGSNVGDRRATIERAIDALRARSDIDIMAVSAIIETEPVGVTNQGWFLNGAIAIRTSLPPRSLLAILLDIERAHGRDRNVHQRWGPRTLDLDLLLYEDRIIDEPGLSVPHPRMHERSFVLDPLAEIAPALVHPALERTVGDLAEGLRSRTDSLFDGRGG